MKMKIYIITTTVALVALWLTSCGGTITLRPDGSLAYTTPEVLKPSIVREK